MVQLDHTVMEQRRCTPSRRLCRLDAGFLILPVLLCFAPAAMAQENLHLSCAPRTFHVVPGEPVRLELTVLVDSAAPIRLHIPADPLLMRRAVEKLPVQRTSEGFFVHKRVFIWQALEPGVAKMDAISVETQGRKQRFPEITITVRDPGP
jgi:hypothetical protein